MEDSVVPGGKYDRNIISLPAPLIIFFNNQIHTCS
ncbi:hypothetical protein SAMN04488122_3706 [Chitinophaga arvensicola]|uniref:Uncharacterized protein n=1 Tax=Chitinophaga arvensicola TaxID=29529 RepID=A0A1I0S5B8_9BACT|nr:hypothetical protein SAMN04488122_3706 [Chitinophaga arvensicola]